SSLSPDFKPKKAKQHRLEDGKPRVKRSVGKLGLNNKMKKSTLDYANLVGMSFIEDIFSISTSKPARIEERLVDLFAPNLFARLFSSTGLTFMTTF
ncbi:Polypeptide N-acetylgalactosaminyltransferase 10, partial [Frankliniella fusca]